VTDTVSQGTTSTTVSSSPGSSSTVVYGQPVTLTATVSAQAPSTLAPSGNVDFVDVTANNLDLGTVAVAPGTSGTSTATLTTDILPLTATGDTIKATFTDPKGNYVDLGTGNTTTGPKVVAAQGSTFVLSLNNPSAVGDPVTFEVVAEASPSVQPPTGTVQLIIDGGGAATLGLGGGVAFFTTSSLTLGNHSVYAVYTSNSANFLSSTPATQAVMTQSVTQPLVPSARVPAGTILSAPFNAGFNPAIPQVFVFFQFTRGKKTFLIIMNGSQDFILGKLILVGISPKQLKTGLTGILNGKTWAALPVFLMPGGTVQAVVPFTHYVTPTFSLKVPSGGFTAVFVAGL
jgi:hypothetical protein